MSASQPHPHPSRAYAANGYAAPANKSTKAHYGQRAVWRCQNNTSGRVHTIHGPLAQILNRYPNDYQLTFLGTERPSNRWFG